MKRLTALVLMVLLVVGGAMPAYGLADTAKSGDEEKARDFARKIFEQNENRDPFAFLSPRSAKKLYAVDTPEKFDLRNVDGKNYVTPVKFQNPFGTCWGFAAIAAAETSIIGSGLAEADGYAATAGDGKKELDLSERHLTYFVNEPIKDKDDPQYGEGRVYARPYTLPDKLNMGGAMLYSASLFASGMGPNLEDRMDTDNVTSLYDILAYGTESWVVQKRDITGEGAEDFCYDDDKNDWSIPDDKRYSQSYPLKESALLPTPAGSDELGQYKYNPDATAVIKNELAQKRAVAIAFHADSFSPSQEAGDGKYISKNWAH